MTEFATFALWIYLRLNRKYSKKFTKNAKRLNIKFLRSSQRWILSKSKQNAQVPKKYVKWKREKPKCKQMVLLWWNNVILRRQSSIDKSQHFSLLHFVPLGPISFEEVIKNLTCNNFGCKFSHLLDLVKI